MEKQRMSLLRLLVGYYGILQIVHFCALALESLRWQQTGVPRILAPPPAGGWSQQARWLLVGTGVADAIVIPFSVLFAWGWIKGKAWSGWLGALTLGSSAFSAVIFGVGTFPTGAWSQNIAYWIEAVLFAPVGFLLILFIRHLLKSPGANATSANSYS
ncbi:MAG: hypothetical protein ACLFWD_09260 [Anaerolineales bacterium]